MNKNTIDSMDAAKGITRLVLSEIDKIFPSKHKVLQAEFHLRNGIFDRT